MFTGIVQAVCPVRLVSSPHSFLRLQVDLGVTATELQVGASVALNGVCLTAVEVDGTSAEFDVIEATARISNLGCLQSGDLVNVERSLRFGDEVGGHMLSGHIADTVHVEDVSSRSQSPSIVFKVPSELKHYLFQKGFIALNGVSLTLAEYESSTQLGTVNFIPETLRRTNLTNLSVGDRLNLEIDAQTQAIVDTVNVYLSEHGISNPSN